MSSAWYVDGSLPPHRADGQIESPPATDGGGERHDENPDHVVRFTGTSILSPVPLLEIEKFCFLQFARPYSHPDDDLLQYSMNYALTVSPAPEEWFFRGTIGGETMISQFQKLHAGIAALVRDPDGNAEFVALEYGPNLNLHKRANRYLLRGDLGTLCADCIDFEVERCIEELQEPIVGHCQTQLRFAFLMDETSVIAVQQAIDKLLQRCAELRQ